MLDEKRTGAADWTDLQYVVELSRHGGLSAAARALGVTHATVARRVAALETRFGCPLFKREAGRYVPTSTGAQVVAAVQDMEEPAQRATRMLAGSQPEIAGLVRMTATLTVATELLAPALAEVRRQHPLLEVEIISSNENLSLARRDVDIALRLARPTKGDLFTRKLGDLAYYRYAARSYLAGRKPSEHAYVGYCNVSSDALEPIVLAKFCSPDQIVMATNDLSCRRAAVMAGLGVGLLPRLIVDREPSLEQLDEAPVLLRELWLVVHRDLRDVPRIRACVDLIGDFIAAQKHRLA